MDLSPATYYTYLFCLWLFSFLCRAGKSGGMDGKDARMVATAHFTGHLAGWRLALLLFERLGVACTQKLSLDSPARLRFACALVCR